MAQTKRRLESKIEKQTTKSFVQREQGSGAVVSSSFDLLSLQEAATLLGVHRNTLYRLIQDEEIPAFRLSRGGHWKFRKRDLEDWLQDKQARSLG